MGAGQRMRSVARELVVPGLMLLCVIAYWVDAWGLSAAALSFPLALTVVLGIAIVVIAVGALFAAGRMGVDRPANEVAPSTAWTLAAKTWTVVLLPVPLIFFWRDLGAIAVFFVYTGGVLFTLGERRRVWLLIFPALLATGLVYLFKTGLYVRLPDLPSAFAG